MKKLIYILIVNIFCLGANAQMKIEKHIDFTGKKNAEFNIQISDSINVHTWNKNEVYVLGSVNINDNKDNEAYKTTFQESGDKVIVKAEFDDDYFKGKKNCCNESEINWTVYVPEKADIKVETINADITVTGNTGSLNLKTISGFIDLTYAENKAADLEFSTISGTVYTNHNLTSSNSKSGMPSHMKYHLNNSGEMVRLETISGDIFFRK